jgi:hypothetical protein
MDAEHGREINEIEHSLITGTMDSLAVARHFGIDPNIVEYEWTNVDYMDRVEYMMVELEMERKRQKRIEREQKRSRRVSH